MNHVLVAILWVALAMPLAAGTFAIAINDRADQDFEAGVQDALDAGIAATSLTLFWDDLEKDDISQATLSTYRSYYGVANKSFLSYLGTLGLAGPNGQDKPALTWLKNR